MQSNFWAKGSVFTTFIMCCIIMALLCSCLATDFWVTSTANSVNGRQTGTVNFGLFRGKKVLTIHLGDNAYTTHVVCMKERNTCMYSCGDSASERLADLQDILLGNGTGWDDSTKCRNDQGVRRARHGVQAGQAISSSLSSSPLGLLIILDAHEQETLEAAVAIDDDEMVTELPKTQPDFMIYGLWVGTIAMLGVAILFVLVAAMFAILNTATNPVETLTGIVGLYVWNGIAMFFEALVLILWGVQFHQRLRHSVLWREEITQQWSTDGLASLGYSYWLVFVAFILHVINMTILWLGTHQKRPKKVQIPIERGNTNAVNMIY